MNQEKFKGKYSHKGNRVQGYDYSSNGVYFITICTKDRQEFFGEIIDGGIVLNGFGNVVKNEIIETEKIRNNITIDEFIIMPNHIHIIVMINNNMSLETHCNIEGKCTMNQKDAMNRVSTVMDNNIVETTIYGVSSNYSIPIQIKQKGGITKSDNIMLNKNSIGFIIRQLKGKTKYTINKSQNQIYFSWQSNYYDRIIRNEDELSGIRKYILENPIKWDLDKNNSENLFI